MTSRYMKIFSRVIIISILIALAVIIFVLASQAYARPRVYNGTFVRNGWDGGMAAVKRNF